MMSYYADTSFLVALYSSEVESARAIRWIQSFGDSLGFTPLHRHELRTAIRLKVFRGESTDIERKQAFRAIDADLEDGSLAHVAIPWTDAFREAERIADTHQEKAGVRGLDLLHLGIALALDCKFFL